MQAQTKILHLIKESYQPRRRRRGAKPKASVMNHRKMGSMRGPVPLTLSWLSWMTLIEHALIFNWPTRKIQRTLIHLKKLKNNFGNMTIRTIKRETSKNIKGDWSTRLRISRRLVQTKASFKPAGNQWKGGNPRLRAAREGSISLDGFKKARIFAGNLMKWSSPHRRIIGNWMHSNQQEPTKRNEFNWN